MHVRWWTVSGMLNANVRSVLLQVPAGKVQAVARAEVNGTQLKMQTQSQQQVFVIRRRLLLLPFAFLSPLPPSFPYI